MATEAKIADEALRGLINAAVQGLRDALPPGYVLTVVARSKAREPTEAELKAAEDSIPEGDCTHSAVHMGIRSEEHPLVQAQIVKMVTQAAHYELYFSGELMGGQRGEA